MKRVFPLEEAESSEDKRLKQTNEKSEEKMEDNDNVASTCTSDSQIENLKSGLDSDVSKNNDKEENTDDKEKIFSENDDVILVGDKDNKSVHNMEEGREEYKDEKVDEKKEGRWQLTPVNVKQRMNYLLSTYSLSDCTFIVGSDEKQEFKLHTIILSMSSPEFEDLLLEGTTVTINDVEPDIFKQVLEYIYLDYINLWSVEKTQALYRASSKFKLPHLSGKAVEFLMDKMNLESIWPIFEAAIDTQDLILIDECSKFFKKNVGELLKHPKFCKVDPSVLCNLVEDNNLNVMEMDLISGVQLWASQRCVDMDLSPNTENKRAVLGSQIIPSLRYLSLSKEIFVNQFAFNKQKNENSILTMEESYAILMNLVMPDSYPMPEGFNGEVKPRSTAERLRINRRIFNPLGTYYNQNQKGASRMDRLTVFAAASMAASVGAKNFSLELTVNKTVVLHGIQLPTFVPIMVGNTPKDYDETYVVNVQNVSKPHKPMMTSLTWSGKVPYNSVTDIMFKDYIKLEKNSKYLILIYTSNMYFVNQKLCTVEEAGSIKFVFKDLVALFGKQSTPDFGFVSQLIYSPLSH